jgi:hypothetical protein
MPSCLDYVRFLSKAAARRQPSAIREASKTIYFIIKIIYILNLLAQLFARSPPSTISFASGSPNASLFPFKDATISLTYILSLLYQKIELVLIEMVQQFNSTHQQCRKHCNIYQHLGLFFVFQFLQLGFY